ncbi:MAG: hypothetical protein FWE86_04830 [Oscillospiraceae bacterium]|nr:hypothetical protein [Oscillospiraceae bacterium]
MNKRDHKLAALKKMLTVPGGCPQCPVSDAELCGLLDKYGEVRAAAYAACVRLSESTSMRLPGGGATPDQSGYWLRLARLYRPDYSRHVGRADDA